MPIFMCRATIRAFSPPRMLVKSAPDALTLAIRSCRHFISPGSFPYDFFPLPKSSRFFLFFLFFCFLATGPQPLFFSAFSKQRA